MTRVQTEYQLWLQDPAVDEQTKKELQAIVEMREKSRIAFIKILNLGQAVYVG